MQVAHNAHVIVALCICTVQGASSRPSVKEKEKRKTPRGKVYEVAVYAEDFSINPQHDLSTNRRKCPGAVGKQKLTNRTNAKTYLNAYCRQVFNEGISNSCSGILQKFFRKSDDYFEDFARKYAHNGSLNPRQTYQQALLQLHKSVYRKP